MSTHTVEFSGIELLSPCPHCSAPMAVNTLTERCRCSSCLSEAALPPSVWDEALGGVERDVVQFAAGYLRHGPEWGEGGAPPGPHVEWFRGHDAPPCPQCQRPMRFSPQLGCFCPGCGATRPISPRPGWLSAQSPVEGFVSDEPSGAAERPIAPVHVACAQCGGPLVADGSSRIVPCGYCAARVALPDAVWAALHPPRVKRRWWLVVRVAEDPRRGPLDLSKFSRPARKVGGCAFWLGFGGAMSVGYMFEGFGPIIFIFLSFGFPVAVFISLWLWGRWRHWRICRPEYEVIGRLCAPWRGPKGTDVRLTPPYQPNAVLGRLVFRHLDERRFKELGGDGGKVRAWSVPGRPDLVHADAMPSALEQ